MGHNTDCLPKPCYEPTPLPNSYSSYTCTPCCISDPRVIKQTQKKIRKEVGMPSFQHIFNTSVRGAQQNSYWNNQSDRKEPHVQTIVSGSQGTNTTKFTRVNFRPGAMSPGGVGVDIKHGSYNRYYRKKIGRAHV